MFSFWRLACVGHKRDGEGKAMSIEAEIRNYYERLVLEEIGVQAKHGQYDDGILTDVACVALNRLPPRYITSEVDLMFYTSTEEMNETHAKIAKAVEKAFKLVEKNKRAPS